MQKIFNHILDDMEIFMGTVSTATLAEEEKSKKKMRFKKSKKKGLFPLRSSGINKRRNELSLRCVLSRSYASEYPSS